MQSIKHGGRDRSYQLFVPASACKKQVAQPQGVPLLIYLHCYGCSCQNSDEWTQQAQIRGVVLTRPCGTVAKGPPSWNAGILTLPFTRTHARTHAHHCSLALCPLFSLSRCFSLSVSFTFTLTLPLSLLPTLSSLSFSLSISLCISLSPNLSFSLTHVVAPRLRYSTTNMNESHHTCQ